MALEYAHGNVGWIAEFPGTTYTVSGLSFEPKALRFYWFGHSTFADINISTAVRNSQRGLGFASSTSSRRCVGSFSEDTAANANCATIARDDCVACTTDGDGAGVGALDLNAINSDGFQLIVDSSLSVPITVFWEAWGGDGITNVTVGDIAEPSATGVQDYSATGFMSGSEDQVVMLSGVQSTAALNTGTAGDSGWMIGYATGAGAENIVLIGNADDASATMDTDGYARGDECLGMIVVGGGTSVDARAALTQFNTDGFRLNWAARAVTDRRYIYMAIKGGGWHAGDYTIDGSSASATATVSGLSFTPKGVSFIGRMAAESTSNSAETEDRIGLGCCSSTSSRHSGGVLDENGTLTCEIDICLQFDSVLSFASTTPPVPPAQSTYDIDAMNSDGFDVIVDVAGGVASEWQGYLAFGDAVEAAAAPSLWVSRSALRF